MREKSWWHTHALGCYLLAGLCLAMYIVRFDCNPATANRADPIGCMSAGHWCKILEEDAATGGIF